jgi:hypothetical protein
MTRTVAARVRAALAQLGRRRSSATLVFTDDLEIRRLNRDYRSAAPPAAGCYPSWSAWPSTGCVTCSATTTNGRRRKR